MTKITRKPGPGAQQLKLMLAGLANKKIKAGIVEAIKYEDGTPVAYVAAIQEFGDPSRSIPPRATFRPATVNNSGKWRDIATMGAQAIAAGTGTTEDMANLIGEAAAGDVRHEMSQLQDPPLTETTLRLRKLKREGKKIGGKVVGEAHRAVNFEGPRPKGDKSADISGVSTKPLVFDAILIGAITHSVEDV